MRGTVGSNEYRGRDCAQDSPLNAAGHILMRLRVLAFLVLAVAGFVVAVGLYTGAWDYLVTRIIP
jgi:hypothetical protein